jgi:hypothetical protein
MFIGNQTGCKLNQWEVILRVPYWNDKSQGKVTTTMKVLAFVLHPNKLKTVTVELGPETKVLHEEVTSTVCTAVAQAHGFTSTTTFRVHTVLPRTWRTSWWQEFDGLWLVSPQARMSWRTRYALLSMSHPDLIRLAHFHKEDNTSGSCSKSTEWKDPVTEYNDQITERRYQITECKARADARHVAGICLEGMVDSCWLWLLET